MLYVLRHWLLSTGPGKSEPSESEKAAEAALEAAIQRTGYASPPSTPKAVDHYAILGLSHDFTPAELKRRYKKASLAAHPDRAGGSTEAFEAVAAAYEVLGDEAKRAACACSTHKRSLCFSSLLSPYISLFASFLASHPNIHARLCVCLQTISETISRVKFNNMMDRCELGAHELSRGICLLA